MPRVYIDVYLQSDDGKINKDQRVEIVADPIKGEYTIKTVSITGGKPAEEKVK